MPKQQQKNVAFFIMPGNALRSLREELDIDLGDEKTSDTLFRFGYRCGENLAQDLDLDVEKLSDLRETLPELIMESGLGRADAKLGQTEMTVLFAESLEATIGGKKPACDFTRGYLAGLTSHLLAGDYQCEEISCISRKDKSCTFRLTQGKGELLPRPETSTNVTGKLKTDDLPPELEDGSSYLFEEEIPLRSYETFITHLKKGYEGLLITREYPEKIRKHYHLESTPMLWLTRTGKEGCIGPEKLSELYHKIGNFLAPGGNKVVLLSGLEYLISQNNYSAVLKFIQLLRDQIALHEAILIAPLSPLTIEERELKLIEREFELIK